MNPSDGDFGMAPLNGYDIDGVLTAGLVPEEPWVVISGRTLAEYDEFARSLAQQAPVYIRCSGLYGDATAAAWFKATMVNVLGVTTFYEDDPFQAQVIAENAVRCQVVLVSPIEGGLRGTPLGLGTTF